MDVWIDADACPVVDIAIGLCEKYHIPVTLVCDTAHQINRDNAKTLIMDKGADSADFAIVNRVKNGDIVIAQDYGLTSMCLARGGKVLHQDGWEYTQWNIDALLIQRHEAKKLRDSGGRTKNQKNEPTNKIRHFPPLLKNCSKDRHWAVS